MGTATPAIMLKTSERKVRLLQATASEQRGAISELKARLKTQVRKRKILTACNASLEATVSVLEYDVVALEERCVLEKAEARLAEVEVERLKEFIRTAGEGSGGACKLDHWAEYRAHTELDTQTTPKEPKP